ncbi:MetQ/NlpA family ABC transporter substrate-binding protein [Actinoplanes subglobosus]|uniref:MetQ/NlpA family ABC transporter substrate-binding protein n=1 Tax=Actinoplanes subglobosus TaxID=1547892 RepID=A0ABV8J251_9ACTN
MRRILAGLLIMTGLAGCGSGPDVTYQTGRTDADTLLVYAGPGDYREILQHTIDTLLPPGTRIQLADAPADAARKVEAGDADLAFYQEGPEFAATPSLSVVARVNVIPYALYSSKWKNLDETRSWINTGVVDDEVNGVSLPHGSKIVLPGDERLFARGLYLLQAAGLVRLDREFGGSKPVDLAITEANVRDSLRHLSLLGLYSDSRLREIYQQYDALVLTPQQAAALGLDPAKDALAVEPGPGNPWARVLIAPSRLAGDPRVLALTHALESPELATYLTTTHPAANLPAAGSATDRGQDGPLGVAAAPLTLPILAGLRGTPARTAPQGGSS